MTPGDLLPDRAARERAVSDFATNLVVEAGAGTGKTSLLVERVLHAVGTDLAPLERLAAITFTEKAAGELRERVSAGLDRLRALAAEEVEPGGSADADRAFARLEVAGIARASIAERALAALEVADRATVTTIHGFAAELLRGHPIESGVDADFLVDQGEALQSLGAELWEKFLARELGPHASRADLWRRLLARVPLPQVAAVATELADFGVPEALLRPADAPADLVALVGAEAARLAAEVTSLLARVRGLSPMPRRYFDGLCALLAGLERGGLAGYRAALADHPAGAEYLEPGGKAAPKLNTGATGVDREAANALSKDLRNFLKHFHRADEAPGRDLLEAIAPFVRDCREEFLRRGWISFDGLLALARDLLRDDPRVRGELKRRYRLLLVDEFQDTDPLQYEIVLFLAERDRTRAAEAWDCELEPGKLFVVGDAKQSIYRFRGADFSAYRRAIGRIIEGGGAVLDLTGNFRSVPALLGPVNELFGERSVSWRPSPQQPRYVPIDPVRDAAGAEPRLELWTLDIDPRVRIDARREAEGRLIAEEIARCIAGGMGPERITILFRAFRPISNYLRPLREHGIPYIVDGGRDFLERPEVAWLLAVLRVLSQPADPVALLAFLRSPAGGVPDTELAAYAAAGGWWTYRQTEVPAASFPRIAASFALLRELAHETQHLPADAVIRRVVERTLQLPLGAAAFEGPQRVANLRKLATAAGELARDGKLSLEQVVEALRDGRLEDIETDRPVSDDAARAVRLTSIHKMKGLENDLVFVADLARPPRSQFGFEADPVKTVRTPGGATALGLLLDKRPNFARCWYEWENHLHEEAEEVRVLYVALTRARERLVVLAGPPRPEGRESAERAVWVRHLATWGYDRAAPPADGGRLAGDAVLHRLVRPGLRPVPVRRTAPESSARAVAGYGTALAALRDAAVPPLRSPSGLHDEDEPRLDSRGAAAGAGGRELGKAVGIALHRLLEQWPGGDLGWLREALPAQCSAAAAEANIESAALVAEVRPILDAFLRSDLAHRLAEVEIVGREVPLLLAADAGGAFRGSIDLVYREPGGDLVVADYKTDREDDESALCERYGEQLGIYVEALRRGLALERAPRAELWLLRTGRRIELSPTP